MTAAKLDPALCRTLADKMERMGERSAADQLTAAADLSAECDQIALQFDGSGIDRTLPLAHQAQVLQEQHHALQVLDRKTEALAEQRLLEINALRAQLAERKTLTEEQVREVVRAAIEDLTDRDGVGVHRARVADRAAKELAGAALGLSADEIWIATLVATDKKLRAERPALCELLDRLLGGAQ